MYRTYDAALHDLRCKAMVHADIVASPFREAERRASLDADKVWLDAYNAYIDAHSGEADG